LEEGFNSATADHELIDVMFAHFPGSSIGVRLQSRLVAVVDTESVEGHGVDGYAARRQLEAELGPLPPTRTHGTATGGEHGLFLVPEGIELTNCELAPGVELKVNGGILVPPSPGYTVKVKTRMAELPEAWVERARKKPKEISGDRESASSRPKVEVQDGGPIPKRTRNNTLVSIAGRLHDGTRDLEQLTADLLAINEVRCDPPKDPRKIERLARWTIQKDPCRPGEKHGIKVRKRIRQLEKRFWEEYGENFAGLGGQSDRDLLRARLNTAAEFGRIMPNGDIVYDMEAEGMAERAGITRPTVYTAEKRLASKIGTRRDTYHRKATEAGAWILPAQLFTTRNSPPPEEADGVVKACAPGVVGLQTPAYYHFGPVNKGEGGVLLALEAHGPLTGEELAEVLGRGRDHVPRVRDLRRRYLEDTEREDGSTRQGLLSRGLVEERDGRYALPLDHQERCEEALDEPYGRTHTRLVHRYSPSEGRKVAEVVEFDRAASQRQRQEARRKNYADQREAFLLHLEERRRDEERMPEAEEECRELLNEMDEERESADVEISASTIRLAPGETVDPETGEVLNSDDEASAPEPEASVSTAVDGRVLPFGDLGRLYPLVDHRVLTDEGPGVLWQVFGDRVGVLLDDGPDEVTFLPPAAVLEGEEAA